MSSSIHYFVHDTHTISGNHNCILCVDDTTLRSPMCPFTMTIPEMSYFPISTMKLICDALILSHGEIIVTVFFFHFRNIDSTSDKLWHCFIPCLIFILQHTRMYLIPFPSPPIIYDRINSSPPGQNGRHFTDVILNAFSWMKSFLFLIQISLRFVPKDPINNNSALFQVTACRRTGDKPLPEPMLTQLTDAYMRH